MKRPLFAVILVITCLALGVPAQVLAVPPAQDQKPVIAQPESEAAVRGVVQIVGTATHPQFQRYELYNAPGSAPSDNAWIFIGPDAHFQQQPLGLLGTWDSRAVPDGSYALRVRVVRQDGNYTDSEPRRVTVANTKPAESPTPSGSPTPTASPTPAGPTPTFPAPTAAAVSTVPPPNRATVAPAKGSDGSQVSATPAAPSEKIRRRPRRRSMPRRECRRRRRMTTFRCRRRRPTPMIR
jgi:hypothetical protein